jgi:hypothetical protein
MDDPHDRRVKGHADPQEGEPVSLLLEAVSEHFDRFGVAAQDDLFRRIDVADVDIVPSPDQLFQPIQGSVRGRHGAGVHVHGSGLVHAEGSLVHNSKPVLQGKDASQAQGGQLAQAVAGHRHRVNTKRDEVSGHGVFHGEQGRLLPPGLLKVLLPIVEQEVKKVVVRCSRCPIQPFPDDGKGLVERLAHAGIVGSLPGKDQGERRHGRILGVDEEALLRQGTRRLG